MNQFEKIWTHLKLLWKNLRESKAPKQKFHFNLKEWLAFGGFGLGFTLLITLPFLGRKDVVQHTTTSSSWWHPVVHVLVIILLIAIPIVIIWIVYAVFNGMHKRRAGIDSSGRPAAKSVYAEPTKPAVAAKAKHDSHDHGHKAPMGIWAGIVTILMVVGVGWEVSNVVKPVALAVVQARANADEFHKQQQDTLDRLRHVNDLSRGPQVLEASCPTVKDDSAAPIVATLNPKSSDVATKLKLVIDHRMQIHINTPTPGGVYELCGSDGFCSLSTDPNRSRNGDIQYVILSNETDAPLDISCSNKPLDASL